MNERDDIIEILREVSVSRASHINFEPLSYLSEEFIEYEQTELQQSEKEMLDLLNPECISTLSETITFEQLSKLTFNKAHNCIIGMQIAKRIKMMEDLKFHLFHLYEATKEYNDKGFGKSMPPKDFQKIMGKIKHLEILQSWLFGIE
jgi:hypothetical protein